MNWELLQVAFLLWWAVGIPIQPTLGPTVPARTVIVWTVIFALVRFALIVWALNLFVGVIRP